jgi:hypothetical protein
LNYPAVNVTLGNGQGFSSEKPAFGFPGGGLGPDNRFSWYFGDSWKIKPNITIDAGLRYARDTGRTDSDIGHIDALDQFNNQFYSGLGDPVRQPNKNFAPQLGIAWDPRSNGKTVIRAGIGLFFENSIWNNLLFDRPARLQQGLFLGFQGLCPDPTNPICGQPIGTVAPQIIAAQQAYQAATLAAGPAANGSYIGNVLADNADTSTNLIAPNYRSARSVQMNFGVQREIRRGMVFSADYLRNVATHTLLIVDTNHVGDSRFLDIGAAQAAISATNNQFGCGSGFDQGSTQCAITAGANIVSYAANGLDSGYELCSGLPCSEAGAPAAAFPGINSALGSNQMLFPIGRSVYNGLQSTLKQDKANPLPGIRHINFQASYAFSRYVSTARDGDFINNPYDFRNPTHYIGPNGLDRTHQISFGGIAQLPAGFQIGITSHFDSPLASDLRLPVSGLAGGVFQTDITGDGQGDGSGASNRGLGDLLPGTQVGDFGRAFGPTGLNARITNFNNTMVGQATPAGQALVANGLMTLGDLQALGGVIGGNTPSSTLPYGPLQLAPTGAIGQAWLKTFDLNMGWTYKFRDRYQIQPGVAFYNLFNFANFDGPAVPFSSILDGSPGSPNGTTSQLEHGAQLASLRLGLGSGVNALGAPRVVEFTLKIKF